MEMRFSSKLRRCHLLLNSVFFTKPGRFPPLITVIVPRCERSCQPVIQVSMISTGNEELHAIVQHCERQRASDPRLLIVAGFRGQKRLEFVRYERGLLDRGCVLDL